MILLTWVHAEAEPQVTVNSVKMHIHSISYRIFKRNLTKISNGNFLKNVNHESGILPGIRDTMVNERGEISTHKYT